MWRTGAKFQIANSYGSKISSEYVLADISDDNLNPTSDVRYPNPESTEAKGQSVENQGGSYTEEPKELLHQCS